MNVVKEILANYYVAAWIITLLSFVDYCKRDKRGTDLIVLFLTGPLSIMFYFVPRMFYRLFRRENAFQEVETYRKFICEVAR